MMNNVKDVWVIVGPTATGKTQLALDLATRCRAEIVCMDSMQVYKQMDIGTAKPTQDAMMLIKHYMLSIIEPDQTYSVAQYAKEATECLRSVANKNVTPILVGGTGLYLKAMMTHMHMGQAVGDNDVRGKYESIARIEGSKQLHILLKNADPLTAARLHPHDLHRVIRALEIIEITGVPLSMMPASTARSDFRYKIIGLHMERYKLINTINQRVNLMMRKGLVDEVTGLLHKGVSRDSQSMQGIGYKELIPFIDKVMPLGTVVDLIKIHTRQYAKRQMTWFRKTPSIHWLDACDDALYKQAFDFFTNE